MIGERVALNFISHLSGVATLTRKYVEKVKGTNAQIYDTRKTTPLWRELEKYAVRSGGGTNHRIGLDDQVLIKENHWRSITNDKVIRRKINEAKKKKFTEIEVRDLNELRCVLPAKPHAILFDNFSLGKLKEGVQIAKRFHPTPVLEASGGVSLENVRAIAKTGVDRISIGALTHSAPAFDFSLLVRDIHSK